MELNSKQQEAKNKINGYLLILAGAGSGKTATLTSRVEFMIKEKDIDPSFIMMLTFTNKAGLEMRKRVANTLGIETPKNLFGNKSFPLIGTFHSIGIFILKEILSIYDSEELNIGFKKDFTIYDEQDKISLLKSIIKEDLKLDEKNYQAKQIAHYIGNAKNSLLTPNSYEKFADTHIKRVVKDIYYKYEERLEKNNALDFDSILLKTLFVLKTPNILKYYEEKYKYIMVDEYQDTNLVQYEIIKLLSSKNKNLAVVGDDNQSIYSWRGANINNILNFKKDYPDATIIKLEQNYRSTSNIIKSANELIKNNKSGIPKELWTNNDFGEKINYIETSNDREEANMICEIIKSKKGSLNDNLILYRTNFGSRLIEEGLIIAGLPYKIVGGFKFYDRKEVKDLLAYLKVIYNPYDESSFKRIINIPTRKIGAKTLEILDSYKKKFDLNYIQILENIDEVSELGNGTKDSIKIFRDLLKNLISLSREMLVYELLKNIIELVGYEVYLKENFSREEFNSKLDNLKELKDIASEYSDMQPRESLVQFLEKIALITGLDIKDSSGDYVTLMTIHNAKGLEYKRVFISGLEEGIFPHIRSMGDDFSLEEERRLMYVGMTRAEKELYISRALERFSFGRYEETTESRFIDEIPKEFIKDYEESKNYIFSNGNSFFSSSRPDFSSFLPEKGNHQKIYKNPKIENDVSIFSVGDRVKSEKFGEGVILSLNGEIAEISFKGVGVKKLNIRIAPIEKS